MLTRSAAMVLMLFALPIAALAETIGEVELTNGQRYVIKQFGTPDNRKNYHVHVDGGFVPLAKVHELARVNLSYGRRGYLVVMSNGELAEGQFNAFFFDRVSYRDPAANKIRSGYSAVMKERGSDGFIFTTTEPLTGADEVVEVTNPNDIRTLKLWKTPAVEAVTRPDSRQVLAGEAPSS